MQKSIIRKNRSRTVVQKCCNECNDITQISGISQPFKNKGSFILITVRKASPMSNHKTGRDNLIYLHILRVQYTQFCNVRRCVRCCANFGNPVALGLRYILICEILPRPPFNNTWQITTRSSLLVPVLWQSSPANFVAAWNWGRSFVSGTRTRMRGAEQYGVETYDKRQLEYGIAKPAMSNIYKRASTRRISLFFPSATGVT